MAHSPWALWDQTQQLLGAAPACSLHPRAQPGKGSPEQSRERGRMAPHTTPSSCSPGFLLWQGTPAGGSALHPVHKSDARQEVWLSPSLTHGRKSALPRLLTPPRSCCQCPFGAGKPTMTSPRCSPASLPPSQPGLLSLSLKRWSSLCSCLETLRPRLGSAEGQL